MFGFTGCWGISKGWGVCIAEISLVGSYQLRSSVVLALLTSLVNLSVKLFETVESIGVNQFEGAIYA